MNRRLFVFSGLASGLVTAVAGDLLLPSRALAVPETTDPSAPAHVAPELCVTRVNEVTAEATGFTRYEHFHQLSLPLSVLIKAPTEGFKIRTTPLDQDSLDEAAFNAFIKETGIDASLRFHSHEVSFKKEELERIASGEKAVKISVLSPKGNPAHDFFFTASRSMIVKIQRGRAAKA